MHRSAADHEPSFAVIHDVRSAFSEIEEAPRIPRRVKPTSGIPVNFETEDVCVVRKRSRIGLALTPPTARAFGVRGDVYDPSPGKVK